jgi:hypothetical protein
VKCQSLQATTIGRAFSVKVSESHDTELGRINFETAIQDAEGMRWVFGAVSGQQHAASGQFTITG